MMPLVLDQGIHDAVSLTRSHASAWECIQLEIAKDTITSYAFLNILTKLRDDDDSFQNFALTKKHKD